MRSEDKRYIKERKARNFLEENGIKKGASSGSAHITKKELTRTPAIKSRTHIFFLSVILALVFLAYHNAIRNGFVWDDRFLVAENVYIRSFSHVPDIFRSSMAVSSGDVNNFYRPIQELSYMADYSIWKDNPSGYHLTNVILHALCAALLYFLTFKIFGSAIVAFVTAAVFGIHPINTEAVTYVSGRADPLYLLFFLAAFSLFLRSTEPLSDGGSVKTGLYAAAVFSYLLSILSKEMAIIFPLFLLLYISILKPRGAVRNRLYYLCAPFGIAAVLYGIARKTFLDFSGHAGSFVMAKFNIFTRLLTTCEAIRVYLSLLAAPFNLHMERKIPVSMAIADPAAVFNLLFVIALIMIAWRLYSRSKRLFFGAGWFFLGLLPVSNIVPINSFISEHWLYLPAIGIYMMAGTAIGRAFTVERKRIPPRLWKGAVTAIVAAILAFFIVLTIERNKDWKDEVSFFKNTLKYSPDNARVHLSLGNTYSDLRQLDNAIEEYKKAIELRPDFAEAYANIAAAHMNSGRHGEAGGYIEKALEIKPDFADALYLMGRLYEKKDDHKNAEGFYLKAIAIKPYFVDCRLRLARLYVTNNQIDEAVFQLEEALKITPGDKRIELLISQYSKK